MKKFWMYIVLLVLVLVTLGFILWAFYVVQDQELKPIIKQEKATVPEITKLTTIAIVVVVILIIAAILLCMFVPVTRPWIALWISLCGVIGSVYCMMYFARKKDYTTMGLWIVIGFIIVSSVILSIKAIVQ